MCMMHSKKQRRKGNATVFYHHRMELRRQQVYRYFTRVSELPYRWEHLSASVAECTRGSRTADRELRGIRIASSTATLICHGIVRAVLALHEYMTLLVEKRRLYSGSWIESQGRKSRRY